MKRLEKRPEFLKLINLAIDLRTRTEKTGKFPSQHLFKPTFHMNYDMYMVRHYHIVKNLKLRTKTDKTFNFIPNSQAKRCEYRRNNLTGFYIIECIGVDSRKSRDIWMDSRCYHVEGRGHIIMMERSSRRSRPHWLRADTRRKSTMFRETLPTSLNIRSRIILPRIVPIHIIK